MEFGKEHMYFSQLRMVCKSIAKDDTWYNITRIEVNEKHIVGTDKRRLAILDNFGLEPGQYEVGKLTQTKITLFKAKSGGRFPKYKGVIPTIENEDCKCCLPNDISLAHYHISKAGVCIDIAFLKDYMGADKYCVVAKDKPVLFFADKLIAAIMYVNPG